MSGEKVQDTWLKIRITETSKQRLEELRNALGSPSIEDVAAQAIESYVRSHGAAESLARLTPRQREVLQLIAEGHKSREIARKLAISVKTVEMHRAQLMETLGLRSIVEVVRFAVRAGVIKP